MKFELCKGKSTVIDHLCLQNLVDVKVIKDDSRGYYVLFLFEDEDFDTTTVSLKLIRDDDSSCSYAKKIVEPDYYAGLLGVIHIGINRKGVGAIYFKTNRETEYGLTPRSSAISFQLNSFSSMYSSICSLNKSLSIAIFFLLYS